MLLGDKYYAGGLLINRDDIAFRAQSPHLDKEKLGVLPVRQDHRAGLTRIEDQGPYPYCAAYASTSIIEEGNRRKKREIVELDPVIMYHESKKVDGMPNQPGTTLTAAFLGAKAAGYLPPEAKAYNLFSIEEALWGIYIYRHVLLGFETTESWSRTGPDGWIHCEGPRTGGHAVDGCAYDLESGSDFLGLGNSWRQAWGHRGFGRLRLADAREFFLGGLAFDW